ncbi:MAG: NINE protein [Saprospiraceae bacterium]|nr:NINE protein [Saprospiraceae bacterium]
MNVYSQMSSVPYNRSRRNKSTALLLTFFFGWIGAHKFYLGRIGVGIFYALIAFSFIPFFLSFIDFIRIATMDKEDFDARYNIIPFTTPPDSYSYRSGRSYKRWWKEHTIEVYEEERPYRKNKRRPDRRPFNPPGKSRSYNPQLNGDFRQGQKYFEDYMYRQALECYQKALLSLPDNPEVLFKMACCNSLLEQKEDLFSNLGKAVANGLKNIERIKTEDALSFLRIQKEYDRIAASGFKDWRLNKEEPEAKAAEEPEQTAEIIKPEEKEEVIKEPLTTDQLLAELKKLGERRQKGEITDAEFALEKQKLFA